MDEIKNELIEKINIQRNVHSFYEHRTKIISIVFKSISIILPALLTFIAFSDLTFLSKFLPSLTEDKVTLIIGLGAFILFLNSVFDEIFEISSKHKEHRNAIEQYTQLKRDIKIINKTYSDESDRMMKLEMYNQRYLQISSNTLPFTEKQFNIAVKHILKRYAIRQVIKKEPFLRFWEVRSKAKEKAKELYELNFRDL